MSDDLHRLETWVQPLLEKLTPAQCRRITLAMARAMRARQQQTMAAQTDPDGNPWQPRKRPPSTGRTARGSIRRKAKAGAPMFRGLRKAKWLKAGATPTEASVQFVGTAARIAALHHFGGPDRVTPGGPVYDYPARPLIGIPDVLAEELRGLLADHLAG